MKQAGLGVRILVALFVCSVAGPVTAQITTGTISGSVKDAQGGVVPGATVVLISESRGTKSVPGVTNEAGAPIGRGSVAINAVT